MSVRSRIAASIAAGRRERPASPRRAAQTGRPTRSSVLLADLLRDEGRDVGDLLVAEIVPERRHPAAAVRDLLDRGVGIRHVREIRAAVPARAERAVTAGAVGSEDGLAGGRVTGTLGRLRAGLLAAVLRPAAATGSGGRAKRPVEPEEPELVAVGRRLEAVALRQEDDVLLAIVLEERGGVVGTGARLEVPEPLAGPGIVRLELAVVATEEDEVALRRARARVAGVVEALLPFLLTRERVDRGERPP